jgi:hypothetical protein
VGSCSCGLFSAAWCGKETDTERMASVKKENKRNNGIKSERMRKKKGKKRMKALIKKERWKK